MAKSKLEFEFSDARADAIQNAGEPGDVDSTSLAEFIRDARHIKHARQERVTALSLGMDQDEFDRTLQRCFEHLESVSKELRDSLSKNETVKTRWAEYLRKVPDDRRPELCLRLGIAHQRTFETEWTKKGNVSPFSVSAFDIVTIAEFLGDNPLSLLRLLSGADLCDRSLIGPRKPVEWLEPGAALWSRYREVQQAHARLLATRASLELGTLGRGGGPVADAATATGEFDVFVLPSRRGSLQIRHSDHVGLFAITQETFNQVATHERFAHFREALTWLGASEEGSRVVLRRIRKSLSDECGNRDQRWYVVPYLLAPRAPEPIAAQVRLREHGEGPATHCRTIAVVGGHWCGSQDVAALLAEWLGWGYLDSALLARDFSDPFSWWVSDADTNADDSSLVRLREMKERDAFRSRELQERRKVEALRLANNYADLACDTVWSHGDPATAGDVLRAIARDEGSLNPIVIVIHPTNQLMEHIRRKPGLPEEVTKGMAAHPELRKTFARHHENRTWKEFDLSFDVSVRDTDPIDDYFDAYFGMAAEVLTWLVHEGWVAESGEAADRRASEAKSLLSRRIAERGRSRGGFEIELTHKIKKAATTH